MELFLVQHGKAHSEAEDPERSLTEEGTREVERIAAWAGRTTISPHEIVHSGKRRAQQTAEILARHLSPPGGVRAVEGLAPADDVEPWASRLAERSDSLMIVGHLPFLARLAGRLVAGNAAREAVRFRFGGIVHLVRDGDGWHLAWAVHPGLPGIE